MRTMETPGAEIAAVFAALPAREVDNLEALSRLCPDKAEAIVKTTGIARRRIAAEGVTPVDLCVAAARRAMEACGLGKGDVAAVVFVSFTNPARMPCGAAQAQAALGLDSSVAAFDISLACSGYVYALSAAAMFAQKTGGAVLLLDGDVQSAFVDNADVATTAVLADAGSATIVRPAVGAQPWKFAFATYGEKGSALQLGQGGKIKMDGFGVFRFAAEEVTALMRGFLAEAAGESFDAFVPHQPNAYMVRELARSVGFDQERTWLSCDRVGNVSSASIPVAIALNAPSCLGGGAGRLALCGFGGGLSAAVAAVSTCGDCAFGTVEHGK